MSSNVINLFEIKRARLLEAQVDTKAELQVQLDLFSEDPPRTTNSISPVGAGAVPALGRTLSNLSDKCLMLAFAHDFTFHDDFLNFCKATALDLVVDMRVAPRLDFVRPVRKQAFELFDMCGIEYRDVLGRLDAITYDLSHSRFNEVIGAVESLHMSHDDGRPTLGLFDNSTFAQFCTAKLSQVLPVVMFDSDAIRRLVAEGARARM